MLTKVEVRTAQGAALSLPLQDISGGYLLKEVEGLDPVKATIVSSTFAQLDGTQYQSSRRENRNIVLKLGYEPDFVNTTVSQLRTNLYKYLMPKAYVSLRFFIDDVHFVDIAGRVESHEAPLFTDDPGVDVVIICFNPDFISPTLVTVPGNTVADATEQLIVYPGTVETGVIFKLMVNRALTEFMIYERPVGGDYQTMEFAALLQAGDIIEISTVSGSKYARLTRAGSQSSILYGVSPASAWINLLPGDNQFRVLAEGAPIPFTIEYTAKYGGL